MKASIYALVLLLGVPAVGCSKVVTYEPSPEQRQHDIENQSLSEAKGLAVKGDLEGAHKKLSQIAFDAPTRRTGEFVEIENAWAEAQIAKADAEPDLAKKMALLQDVSKASAVSGELRAKASNKLALAIPDPALPPVLVNYDPVAAKANLDKCKELLFKQKMNEAKDLLYPRVIGGIASPDEKEMLAGLCANNASCVNAMLDAGAIDQSIAKSLMTSTQGSCASCPPKK